jgi:calcineurin-like phosphoesterase family protein
MAIFFTSDTHFGHAGALALYRRPFNSVREMNEGILDGWNRVVGEMDEVWHLGDFAVTAKRRTREPEETADVVDLFRRLKGKKYLIRGNNDPPWVAAALVDWCSVEDYREIEREGVYLVLCHYPFRTWNRMSKGAINLHGHSHGRLKPLPRQVDVGVDAQGFRPVTLQEILAVTRRPARREAV